MNVSEAHEIDCAGISEMEIPALVLKAQAGDADAFGELVERIEPKLHRHALFLCGEEQQALDLMQETMIEAWKHIGRYDGRAQFFTWACSIMAHRHYDWVRRWRLRVRALTQRAAEADVSDGSNCSVENADRIAVMRECLDALPAKQRLVIYLRFYAGESLDGIAALVPCSLGTVKSRLFHGLERLARMKQLQNLRPDRPAKL